MKFHLLTNENDVNNNYCTMNIDQCIDTIIQGRSIPINIDIFFWSYPSYISFNELITKLCNSLKTRLYGNNQLNNTNNVTDQFKPFFQLIYHWIKLYPQDFTNSSNKTHFIISLSSVIRQNKQKQQNTIKLHNSNPNINKSTVFHRIFNRSSPAPNVPSSESSLNLLSNSKTLSNNSPTTSRNCSIKPISRNRSKAILYENNIEEEINKLVNKIQLIKCSEYPAHSEHFELFEYFQEQNNITEIESWSQYRDFSKTLSKSRLSRSSITYQKEDLSYNNKYSIDGNELSQSRSMPHLHSQSAFHHSKIFNNQTQIDILQIPAETLSMTFTYHDAIHFQLITKRELLNKQWTKENNKIQTPNIIFLINQFNQRSYWITTLILESNNTRQRKRYLKHFIRIAFYCLKELKNYYNVFIIVSSLSMSVIQRLKNVWNLLNNQVQQQWNELKLFTDSTNNYKIYRNQINNFCQTKTINKTNNPNIIHQHNTTLYIPHLALILKDCFQLCEIKLINENNEINIKTLNKMYEIINEITNKQHYKYPLPLPIGLINKIIITTYKQILNENEMWEQSYSIQPKNY